MAPEKMLRNDKVRIAGKTGTCYMIEGGGYSTSKSASLSADSSRLRNPNTHA